MKVKTCPAAIKAAGAEDGADEGVFEAIVAAYNVDSVNDRIVPGAFKKSLDAWKASGDPIPVLWAHKSDDPDYHIGQVLEAEERPEGLWVKARVDLDEPKSRKIFKLMKGRRIRSFSFSYDIVAAQPGKKDDGGDVQELHELHIHEIGPCLIPANRETNLLGTKNDPTRADDDLDAKHVREAQKAALDVLIKAGVIPAPAPTVPDVVAHLKGGGTLCKEHHDVLASMLAQHAAHMEALADVLDVFGVEPDAAEKATPTQLAASAAAQATEQPARPGTASVTAPADLHRLAFLEAELAVEDY